MWQNYDVSLKALFQHDNKGVVFNELVAGEVIAYEPTEQPLVSNLRADMVVRTADGWLRHIEFQTTNDA